MREYMISGAIVLAALGGFASTTIAKDAPAAPAAAAAASASQGRLEADVRFLADDVMEGRESGKAGYDIAAGYVAGQFAAMGVKAGGDGGTYFQKVPMIAGTPSGDKDGALSFTGGDLPEGLIFGDDYVTYGKLGKVGADGTGTSVDSVEGELVFVGNGFAAQGYDRDDFKGVDLTGKIAVIVRGSPSGLNSEEGAHFGATLNDRLSERGAIGVVMLFTPKMEDRYPFAVVKRFTSSTGLNWATKEGEAFTSSPNIRGRAILSPAVSKQLFAGQPVSWDDIGKYEQGEIATLPSFGMGISAKITWGGSVTRSVSSNVVGVVPGTDPALADEYVIVTAHLDHTGMHDDGELDEAGEKKDHIYNGAMDNATGTASMLEVARMMVKNPARRPVMFVALTAEEKGLIGSDFMARNDLPTGGKPVANINLDMPIVTYELKDVVAFGAERSTMFGPIEAAVKAGGMTLSPDPIPEQGLFTRSDQYSFVQQGVPSLFLVTGHGGDGAAAQADFLKNHYHKPSDEVALVKFDQLKRFTDVNFEITESVANMATRPVWVKGDFFGSAFGGEMQQ